MMQYDAMVFIGRFQPFHLAHWQTVKIALQQAKQVILCLGSAQDERSLKNPFLASERQQMILSNFDADEQQRIVFVSIIDVYNDVKWKALVRQGVANCVAAQASIALIGHMKDESSYYLDLFPEWDTCSLDSLHGAISATPLRHAYYEGEILSQHFPAGTIEFLTQFQHSEAYHHLQQQFLQQHQS